MYTGFDFLLLFICVILLVQTNQYSHRRISRALGNENPSDESRNFLNIPSTSTISTQSVIFFQNEPVPLAPSVVDDLTTLASSIYIISIIAIIFVFLAWITHYNAPCSSMITSILSTITGLPEPIIRSVALCGTCCVWCESTWMFRRIHQFNMWISEKVNRFISVTCKLTFDTTCPCCRPPDTPSNRSIIGSLPASIIAMIGISDSLEPSSPTKTKVTTSEPTSQSLDSTNINIDSNASQVNESLNDHKSPVTRKEKGKKRGKRPRKRKQPKQRSAMGEQTQIETEINENSQDDDYDHDIDEVDENTEMY